jgi:hypothetical protein
MEALFLIALTVFYLLFDAPSAARAFDSRIHRLSGNSDSGRSIMIYVFARWLPEKIRLDLPTIYYIPCDSRDIAETLAGTLPRFGTDKGNIIELPDIDSLRKHIFIHYRLSDFELCPFPIPPDKLLEGMD